MLCCFSDEVKSPARASRVRCLSAGRQGSSLVQKTASSAWFFLQFVAPGCCITLTSNLPTVQISWPGLSPQRSVTEETTVLLWGTRRKLLCRSAALNTPRVRKYPPFRSPTGCVCLFVYDLETSAMRAPTPTLGCGATESKVRGKGHPKTGYEDPEGE